MFCSMNPSSQVHLLQLQDLQCKLWYIKPQAPAEDIDGRVVYCNRIQYPTLLIKFEESENNRMHLDAAEVCSRHAVW